MISLLLLIKPRRLKITG